MKRMPEDVQELVAQERAWREGYYTGKRDYAGSVTGGVPISTPNPYTEQLEAAYSRTGVDDEPR